MNSNRADVERWLSAYGNAWERRDALGFSELFTTDALYYWTPFDEPNEGRGEVRAAVEAAVSTQENIGFEAEVLAMTSEGAIVRWTCSFDRVPTGKRVHLDGIFLLEFSRDGLCRRFREWWHSDEDRP